MAPRFRLIALDIDGTLLDPKGRVRPRVRGAIRQACLAGCQIILATGRRFSSARPVADELGLSLPIILHAGALVRESPTAEVLFARHIPLLAARVVIQTACELGLQPIVCENALVGERLFAGPPELDSGPARRYLGRYADLVIRRVPDRICGNSEPLSIAVLDAELPLRRLGARLETVGGCVASVSVIPSFSCHVLDVIARNGTKGDAIRFLAERAGIGLDEVLAIGDNGNDVAMLQAAGMGVAVANASDELLAVADAVVASNAEDGVAEAIERFVL